MTELRRGATAAEETCCLEPVDSLAARAQEVFEALANTQDALAQLELEVANIFTALCAAALLGSGLRQEHGEVDMAP